MATADGTRLELREVPGLPAADACPPIVAESGDPFAALRVVHLLARLQRGSPVRIGDVVDRLNREHLDWRFDRAVVVDAALQLQANWMADYRTAEGIVLGADAYGPTVEIEDTPRVDPWMAGQVRRLAETCTARLRAFARDED
jgi:hypothetical protein